MFQKAERGRQATFPNPVLALIFLSQLSASVGSDIIAVDQHLEMGRL